METNAHIFKTLIAVLILACLAALPVQAATRAELSFEQVVTNSKLIFEGRVVASESRWVAGGSAIATFVTFAIDDVIAGTAHDQRITVRFMGGEIDGFQMEISELEPPVLGERGIYFVNDTDGFNPLSGWDKGHYLLIDVPGFQEQKVFTPQATPVTEPSISDPAYQQKSAVEGSSGSVDYDQAITKQRFKQRIRKLRVV